MPRCPVCFEPYPTPDHLISCVDGGLVKTLRSEGIEPIIGKDAVLDTIKKVSDGKSIKNCSGYGIFPDGTKCKGCKDCKK